jgi:ribosomal protein S13
MLKILLSKKLNNLYNMPTLQEINAKRKELWVSAIEARKAIVWSSIPTTPIAWTPPPITPTPQAPMAQPEARAWDTVVWAWGQKFIQANNQDMTTAPVAPPQVVNQSSQPVVPPVQNPVQPTAPQPVSPKVDTTTPKTDVPVDYNAGLGREMDIAQHLDTFKSQGMNSEQMKKSSGYYDPNISTEKKAQIDAYTQAHEANVNAPMNVNDAFNAIRSGVTIPDAQKSTPAYKIAQNRNMRVNMYANKTPTQLSQEMTNGRLIEWSQAWEDLSRVNPKLTQDVSNLRKVNKSTTNIFTEVKQPDGSIVKENNLVKTFKEQYEEDFHDLYKMMNDIYKPDTAEQVRNALFTPDVKMAEDKATKIELEMNNIQAQMDAVDKSVDAEMVWSWTSGNRVALEKSLRKEKLRSEYTAQLDNYKVYANKANNLINQNSTVYTTTVTQRQKVAASIDDSITSTFKANVIKQNALTQNQALFDQKLTQEAQTAKDPISAVKSVIKTFTDLGIVPDRTESEMIADVNAKIESGMTLGGATTELQKAFKSKPEYAQIMAKKQGDGVSYQTFGDKVYKKMPNGDLVLTNIDANKSGNDFEFKEISGKTYKINKTTGWYEIVDPTTAWSGGDLRYLANQFPWQAWAKNNNPAGITWNANFDKWTGTAKLLTDAWVQFSKGTERPASEWGNYVTFPTIEDWLKAQRIIMSQTYWNMTVWGMLAKWVGTSEWPNYAKQVAWNAWIDENAIVSSLSEDQLWKLQMAKINKESPGLGKILSQGSAWSVGGNATVTPSDIQTYNSTTFKPQTDLKTPEQKAKYQQFLKAKSDVMGSKEASIQDILSYSAWGKDLTDATIKPLEKFNSALDMLGSIQDQISTMDTWPIMWRLKWMNPYDTDAQVLKAQLTALMPTIARWVYGEVGVLTDNDIRLYAQTIPNLTSTKDVNNAVLAMSLKVIAWGYKRQLQTLAAAWKDVSGFSGIYDSLMGQVSALEWGLPWGKQNTPTGNPSWVTWASWTSYSMNSFN